MRLRIADRVLVGVAGILLLACCAGIVAQMFFGADLVHLAVRLFTSDSPRAKAILIGLAAILLLLGCYCVLVLFRHRKRKDKFILQKTDGGELAISINALENMIQKCLDQHPELDVQKMYLENRKGGLLIRTKGSVAGGISIPLTVDSLQKQIRQYVTACSGVEIKGIRVEIDASGEDAVDAPFAIAAPAARPLLREGEKKRASAAETEAVQPAPAQILPAEQAAPAPAEQAAQPVSPEPVQAAAPRPVPPVVEDDDRPLHQRLFSTPMEECFVPEPPAEAASFVPEAAEEAAGEAGEEISAVSAETVEQAAEDAPKTAEEAIQGAVEAAVPAVTEEAVQDIPEWGEETIPDAAEPAEKAPEQAAGNADPEFLDSLKAFDDIIQGREDNGK